MCPLLLSQEIHGTVQGEPLSLLNGVDPVVPVHTPPLWTSGEGLPGPSSTMDSSFLGSVPLRFPSRQPGIPLGLPVRHSTGSLPWHSQRQAQEVRAAFDLPKNLPALGLGEQGSFLLLLPSLENPTKDGLL